MITSQQDYLGKQYIINDFNLPTIATLLPSTEKRYHIDLQNRTVEAPEYLGVIKDHYAETIYFVVDRYFDTIDLTTTNCIIQYTNKTTGNTSAYIVPFYDIFSENKNNPENPKILFPWCISKDVTEASGTIEFSICFFKMDGDATENSVKKISYNLNTLPAISKVLQGFNSKYSLNSYYGVLNEIDLNNNSSIGYKAYNSLLDEINKVKEAEDLYWIILE